MDKETAKGFGYAFRPIIDLVFAVIGVVVLALTFSITRDWFKVSNEMDWIAALIFFFGMRIGNRLDLIKESRPGNADAP